jgi:hypothetical protein
MDATARTHLNHARTDHCGTSEGAFPVDLWPSVEIEADRYETFERMPYVCFHYEFEHDPTDPDEASGRCRDISPVSTRHSCLRCPRWGAMRSNSASSSSILCERSPIRQE